MSHARHPSIGRPLAVWAVVTCAVTSAVVVAGGPMTSLASEGVWRGSFEDLLVVVAAAALVLSACWLWLVTTATVADLLVGRPSPGHGLTRRLVLTACGAAVVASVASPALAGASSDDRGLAGLPFPDRAVATAPPSPAPQGHRVVVREPVSRPRLPAAAAPAHGEPITVRPGDSLWSIARDDLGPEAGLHEIDERWRALYAANRGVIGPDPHLIVPGQHLRPDPDR